MLDLSDNNLDELPPDIGSCYSLTSLNVSSNWIKTLPDEMAQLIHLESLLFFSNKISVLPDWLSELPLTDLNGFNNKILKLPPTFGKLCELGEVNLAANIIMQVPLEAVEYWRSVTILNLYDCRLMKLCSFAGLENLEELRLFNNNLDEVPELGSRLNKLKSAPQPLPRRDGPRAQSSRRPSRPILVQSLSSPCGVCVQPLC